LLGQTRKCFKSKYHRNWQSCFIKGFIQHTSKTKVKQRYSDINSLEGTAKLLKCSYGEFMLLQPLRWCCVDCDSPRTRCAWRI